MKPRANTVRIY